MTALHARVLRAGAHRLHFSNPAPLNRAGNPLPGWPGIWRLRPAKEPRKAYVIAEYIALSCTNSTCNRCSWRPLVRRGPFSPTWRLAAAGAAVGRSCMETALTENCCAENRTRFTIQQGRISRCAWYPTLKPSAGRKAG